MGHKLCLVVVIIVILIMTAVAYGLMHTTISALSRPGPFETAIATKAKEWFISRGAHSVPAAPAHSVSSGSDGEMLFGMGCATCHGKDGRNATPIGGSMYPRVLDLGSPEVQHLSDRELFWVVKNGIRFSGMPGFARILSDEQIWDLTHYVRSLGNHPKR
ncbi:MAG: cytochrome c [Terriglobales bacterium]